MHYCFFISGSWEKNGTHLRLLKLGAALIGRGVHVSYLVDRFDYNLKELELPAGAQIEYVDLGSHLARARRRRKILRRIRPDYLHVLAPAAAAFISLFGLRGVPIVVDYDEWPARRPFFAWWRRLFHRIVDRWILRRAVLVVVASRIMQKHFRQQLGVQSLYVPHAWYMPAYPDGPSPFAEPTAVYMGSLYSAYDHDVLFGAADLLHTRGFPVRMEIIGGGPEQNHWRQFVAERGITGVNFIDYLEGEPLWQHLRHAHVLLFPLREREVNLYRCPGKTFFYAQALRPVIASRVGEVFETLGDQATYAEATPEAFADALEAALRQPTLPDVQYTSQTWDDRAATLLHALADLPYRGENQPPI